MIKVFSFQPKFFNNNGDQGNLEALSHFTSEALAYVELSEADFVLFGDGSRAAMREFKDELDSCIPELDRRLGAGSPTLIVGSCYEHFSGKLLGLPALSYGKRVSEFRVAESGSHKVKGYRNTEVTDSDLFISEGFVATTLFGPVLAKNPDLLRSLVGRIGLNIQISDLERDWIEKC